LLEGIIDLFVLSPKSHFTLLLTDPLMYEESLKTNSFPLIQVKFLEIDNFKPRTTTVLLIELEQPLSSVIVRFIL
jgi:hypothetical protein